MKINIQGHRKIAEIQAEFNRLFPYLNLEFISLHSNPLDSQSSPATVAPHLSLNDIREKDEDGELVIHQHMTIMQLENLLSDEFGLHVKVIVKQGKSWIRPWLNGYWMLHHKNEEGRRISAEYSGQH